MPGSKGLSPHELAHKWVKDLRTRPDMSIKVGGAFAPDIKIIEIRNQYTAPGKSDAGGSCFFSAKMRKYKIAH